MQQKDYAINHREEKQYFDKPLAHSLLDLQPILNERLFCSTAILNKIQLMHTATQRE